MFASIVVERWEDIRTLGARLRSWIFRGQASAEWGLSSSIERLAAAGSTPVTFLYAREAVVLRQFQRRAHLVLPEPPALDDRLEWLAILQHHGGPTRMLDFTESMYIAAFFAIEPCQPCDAAIWAVDSFFLILASGAANEDQTLDDMNATHIRMAEAILAGQETAPGVLNVQPERLNARMSVQKGVFLFPKDVRRPFVENLGATMGADVAINDAGARLSMQELLARLGDHSQPNILKIILPRSIHEDILADLRDMNIDANSLFPGPDGFARSLNSLLRMPEFVRQRYAKGLDPYGL